MPARPRFAPRKPGAPSVGRRRGAVTSTEVVATVPEGITSDEELAELIGSLTGKEVKFEFPVQEARSPSGNTLLEESPRRGLIRAIAFY